MGDATPAEFIGSRSATWFVAFVLVGMAGIVAFSVIDRPKTAVLERFSQTTAAGDTHFYTLPNPPLAVPEPVFTWQGRPWAPATYDKVKINDPDMRRVATDEATGLTIYEPREGKPAGYFIKIAVGEYLPVVAR